MAREMADWPIRSMVMRSMVSNSCSTVHAASEKFFARQGLSLTWASCQRPAWILTPARLDMAREGWVEVEGRRESHGPFRDRWFESYKCVYMIYNTYTDGDVHSLKMNRGYYIVRADFFAGVLTWSNMQKEMSKSGKQTSPCLEVSYGKWWLW